jgi:hypothetical protein
MPRVGEGQDANNAGRGSERVTIAEAATLLGVHPNTVRNRVRAGVYRAEKVVTERGPTWMIDRDSLTTNALSSDSQQLVGRVPQEALTALAREIVREAGLQRDPEREARLEANKVLAESAKTQILISSGSLVGIAAVVGILPSSTHLLYLWASIFVLGGSVLMGFAQMFGIALALARQRPAVGIEGALGPTLLASGLFVFGVYVLYNIPLQLAEGRYAWTKDQLVVYSGIASVCLVILGYTVRRLVLRRRRSSAQLDEGRENRP